MTKRIENWWHNSPNKFLDILLGIFIAGLLGVIAFALVVFFGSLLVEFRDYLWHHFNSLALGVGRVVIFFGAAVGFVWLLQRTPNWIIVALFWIGLAAAGWWFLHRK